MPGAGPSPPGSDPTHTRARRRRWPWIVLAAVVVLGVGFRLLLPIAVERAVAWGSRRYVGLPASVEAVHFSLIHGGVSVDGFTVGPKPDPVTPLRAAWRAPVVDPDDALVHWKRVAVRFSWGALLHHTVLLKDVEVDAPDVRVIRETDGRIDPLRNARPTLTRSAQTVKRSARTPPAKAPAPSPSRPAWKIQIDHFELRHPEVQVVDEASGSDVIHFSLEDFGLEQVAYRERSLALGGVSIRGPVLRVRRALLLEQAKHATPSAAAPRAPAGPAEKAPGSAAPGYRIAHVDVEHAEFVWITDDGPVQVALTLHASDVTAQSGQRFPVDLQLEIDKGRVDLHGQAGIAPPAFAGSLTWTDLPFPLLALASEPDLAHWLRSCSSNGDLSLDADLAAKDRPDVLVSGQTAMDDVWAADRTGKQVSLKWKHLGVGIHRIAITLPRQDGARSTTVVDLDRVALVDPEILYTRPSPALDALLAGLQKNGPKSETPAKGPTRPAAPGFAAGPPAPAPVELSLASLDLSGANLELLDTTVEPEARTQVRDLSLSARDLHYPATAVQAVRLQATLPERAPLAVNGGLGPGHGHFTVSLKQLDLPSFDPYAIAAGATISRGHASIQTQIHLRGQHIEADNDLVLSELGVALRNPQSFQRTFGVPIDLALALLRDPSGNIDLSIPVELQAKAARVSLGAVVESALRQALVGALTAPLKMAGAAFSSLTKAGGTGGISIEPVEDVPGNVGIAVGQASRVDGIARLLESRPTLGLVLRGRSGPTDRPGLAEQILIARVEAGKDLPDVEGAGFFARRRLRDAVERRAKGEPTGLSPDDQALYEKMIAAVPVPEERLRALAHERADDLRALLVARPGIDPSRVTVGEQASTGPPAVLLGFQAA